MARDVVHHTAGPLTVTRVNVQASEGLRTGLGDQGDKDSNGNPCYCNPPEKASNKQCRAGYTCDDHTCAGPGPVGVCQKAVTIDNVPAGGACDVVAGQVCVAGLNCLDGVCRQKNDQQRRPRPGGRRLRRPGTGLRHRHRVH